MMDVRRSFLKKIGAIMSSGFLTSPGTLYTKDDELTKLRFAIASDGHFGQDQTPYEMYYKNLVKWINNEHAQNGLDAAFLNGDLIHDDPKYLPLMKEYLDRLNVPYYVGRGNHDRINTEEWKNLWGYAPNHTVEMADTAFILADTSNEAGDYLCADTGWISDQLAKNQLKNHIFLFMHISQNDWTRFGVKCTELLNVITSASNVKAIFHGHDHQEDDHKILNKKPFFFSGHFGGSWGVEYKGFRICEIDSEKLVTYMVNPVAMARINTYIQNH